MLGRTHNRWWQGWWCLEEGPPGRGWVCQELSLEAFQLGEERRPGAFQEQDEATMAGLVTAWVESVELF